MVASGVPNENEGRHVFEVAEMSLEIRAISLSYTLENDKNYKVIVKGKYLIIGLYNAFLK